MIEGLPEREVKLKVVREHKWAILGGIAFFLVVTFFFLLISGRQDCEITSLQEGVVQVCRCQGLVITVKSTTNSKEMKTVCLGRIAELTKYKE